MLVLTVSLLSVSVLSLIFYLGNKLASRNAPLIYAAVDIKLHATTAHLWFAEVMSGDRHEKIESVWMELQEADWYAEAMLIGGSNADAVIPPLQDHNLRSSIITIRSDLANFRKIAENRFANFGSSSAGTSDDKEVDALFRKFINTIDRVERRIKEISVSELERFRWLSLALIAFSIIIFFTLSMYIYRKEIRSKQQLKSIAKARLEAENATLAKAQFLATMSHEIRTPLNGVIGMAQLLDDTPLSDDQRSYLNTILKSGDGLLAIINDILDFSKLEADMSNLEIEPFDLEKVSSECMELVAGACDKKEVEFIFDYDPECNRIFDGDSARIRQILLNLLGNSVKFTHQGQVKLSISQKPVANGGNRLNIDVEDSGIGIPSDAMVHLFDEFSQADSSTTRKYGGTGLGLTITQKLVKKMGLEIAVDSVVGQGSRFSVFGDLPVSEDDTTHLNLCLSEAKIIFFSPCQERGSIYKNLLEAMGAQCILAASVEALIDIFRSSIDDVNPVQLLIFDYPQFDLSIFDVCKQIRDLKSLEMPKFVALSSSRYSSDIPLLKETGFTGFINRFIKQDLLGKTLREILSRPDDAQVITELYFDQPINPKSEFISPLECRILLADDVKANQIIASKILQGQGAVISLAANGREAVDMYLESSYDLIFMDWMMPVMDGLEATQKIREFERKTPGRSKTPIIGLTANASAEDRETCLQAGLDDVVIKPFKKADLQNSLKKWLLSDKFEVA